MAETRKAHARRVREGFYERFVPLTKPGIDIGCQADPLTVQFRRYDIAHGDGDATHMADVPDDSFHTVYASHVLEHLADPWSGLRNWYRILSPGGFLIVCVPHRDLYEKRDRLPSRWNEDHKWFWLPHKGEQPHTLGLAEVLASEIPSGEVQYVTVQSEGWTDVGPNTHSHGEYSIEAVIRKPPLT